MSNRGYIINNRKSKIENRKSRPSAPDTRHPMAVSVGANTLSRQCGAVDLLDLIGNTPLLRLRRLAPANPRVEIYAKAEWTNPGGSVKDRPAKNMILEGERSGQLQT